MKKANFIQIIPKNVILQGNFEMKLSFEKILSIIRNKDFKEELWIKFSSDEEDCVCFVKWEEMKEIVTETYDRKNFTFSWGDYSFSLFFSNSLWKIGNYEIKRIS